MPNVEGSLEELPGAVEVEGSLEGRELPGVEVDDGSLEAGFELEELPGAALVEDSLALLSSLNLAVLCRCRLFVFQLVDTLLSAMVLDLCLLCRTTREFSLRELCNRTCVTMET